MRTRFAFGLFLILLGAAVPTARAEYPTVQSAGFHHCALIYDRPTRTPADLAPYAAYDKQPAWLFDAFLFLIQNSGRGIRTEFGETQQVDWIYQLDRWFSPDRDLTSLDTAVADAAQRLGAPPAKRRIMLSIPYINPAVRDFGTINGVQVDLSTPEGRNAAVSWYVAEAVKRFQNAHFRHLELWGFYWMREDIGEEDVPIVKAAAGIIHARGYRLLWIPCNGDTGTERWKRAGVDVAIYQPNYAFGTWQNNGRIGRNRIAATARTARANGLGVEIEAFAIDTRAADRRVFAQYLADGAPKRYGYQAAPTGYYLSDDLVERTSRSRDAAVRQSYDTLAHYVRNLPVPDPDPPIAWRWKAIRGSRVAEARFAAPRSVAALEVFLKAPAKRNWCGAVEVSVLRPNAKGWTPGGWAYRYGSAINGEPMQWFLAPVGGQAVGIRAVFRPGRGSGPLLVSSLAVDPNDVPAKRSHLALNRPYTFAPAPQRQTKYADNGHLLTDGVTEGGFRSGHTVGWMSSGRTVAVCFDLGSVMPVTEASAYVQGGGSGAVGWPSSSVALFSTRTAPPTSLEGRGVPPAIATPVAGSPVKVDVRRSPTDMDGHITFRPGRIIRARYVTLLLGSEQWLMLSEVHIIVRDRNVAPEASYTLRPMAGASGDDSGYAYPDNAARLTDGVVAQDFTADQLTGWQNDDVHTVTVDLGSPSPVREVTVWSLQGGQSDIHAPGEVIADVSPDGSIWRRFGKVQPVVHEDGSTCVAMPVRLATAATTQARYVRVQVKRSRGWTMLSEIEVR